MTFEDEQSWNEKWGHTERHPICLNAHTVMLIQLFTRQDSLQDAWTWDILQKMHYEQHAKAATQFMAQLQGHDCMAFLIALREVLDKEIKDWETRTGQVASDKYSMKDKE